MSTYQVYHKHTVKSNVFTSDSTVSLRDYCNRAQELGQGIISSVEHGWQGDYYQAYELSKEYGLKLVIGAEAYWVKDRTTDDKSNCHIVLIAKNENGRRALNDVLSEANITGFYYRPRLDIPLIMSLPKDDIIVTTACVAYWKYDDIENITEDFASHFGNNFYLEVQPHVNVKQAELNSRILKLHDKLRIPLIAGTDSHFILPTDAEIRDDFLRSKEMNYEDENDWFMDVPDRDTLYNRFAKQTVLSHSQIEEAIANTNVFLDVEEYNSPIFNDDIKMPSLYPGYTQAQKDEEYKKLIWQGWDACKHEVPEEQWPHYVEEINKEVDAVIETKMADYFIDNYYIMKKGKENGGWLTKSGRGSGVSFYTNKLLGFTEVDRIAAKIHIYPERFMSATRILQSHSLPDIDHNEAPVEPFARAQKEILGEEHSYPLIAYNKMKTSAAWKLYAKAQDIPFDVSNAISDQLKRYELAVKHADDDEKDDIDVDDYIGKEYKKIFEKSKDYLGVITSWSIHPCSYLIYDGDIRKEVGLVKIKDHLCAVMDGYWAEKGHFLKQDHLKVSVVEAIYKMFHRIGREPPTVNELLNMCPPDDPVWDIYARGCCIGINQVEKEGTAARVAKYKPKNIAELTAFVAAIRPGFASLYKKFENREPYEFGVPSLDAIIQTKEVPNSYIMYQEQVMAVLNYAGIPMDECYTAIKNISKKRAEKVLAYKDAFSNGLHKVLSEKEHLPEDKIEEITAKVWQTIEDASGYGYNSSHAYCVALDSLYCAWVKAHYPLEFYETYIQIQEAKGDKDKMNAAKEEAESFFGIKFQPLRYGQDNRTIHADYESNSLINTIGSIKGYGVTVGRTLYECSKYDHPTFIDLLYWLDNHAIKEAKFKPLIEIGYFSNFGNQRELLEISKIWDFFKQGSAKSIRKTAIIQPEIREVVERHAKATRKDGSEAASFTFLSQEDVFECMRECEKYVRGQNLPDLDMSLRVKNCLEILGYVDIATGKEEDRRRLLITDVIPLKGKDKGDVWAYRLGTRSLGSGKAARISVKTPIYEYRPINKGDIIYAAELWQNKAGYWYLMDYRIE